MPDPTLVQSSSGTSATASTVVTFGSAAGANHLLLLLVASDDYRSGDPSGWTLLSPGGDQHTFLGHAFWWDISAGGETSVTYAIGSGANSTWHFLEFDNVDTTSPLDTAAGTFVQAFGTSITTSSIVPSTGRRLCVATIGSSAGVNTDISGWTNGYTEALDSRTPALRVSEGTAWQVLTGDGATSTSTGASWDDGSNARTAIIASFRASTAGSGVAVQAVCAVGGAGSATGRKVPTTSARSTAGLTGRDTARKLSVTSARATAGLVARDTARKVATTGARSPVGLAEVGTARKVSGALGVSPLGVVSVGSIAGAGARPAVGRAAVGLGTRVVVVRVAPTVARSVVGARSVATSRKVSPAAARAPLGVVSQVGALRRVAAAGRAALGLLARHQGAAPVTPKAGTITAGRRSGPVGVGGVHSAAGGSPGTRPGPTISGGS